MKANTPKQQELLDDLQKFKEQQEKEIKKMMDKYTTILIKLIDHGGFCGFIISQSLFNEL